METKDNQIKRERVCVKKFMCWETVDTQIQDTARKNQASCQGIVNISEILYCENKR